MVIANIFILPLEIGVQFHFGTCRLPFSARWLSLPRTKVGYVETNPGPTTHTYSIARSALKTTWFMMSGLTTNSMVMDLWTNHVAAGCQLGKLV